MNSIITSNLRSWACGLLCLCMVNVGFAGMITTEQFNVNTPVKSERQLIQSTLLRDDVKQVLLAHGVDPAHVQQRIDQLTDQEIQQLAQQFDDLPAASGVGLVLFATGPIVFMLELMGFTDLTTTF